MKLFRNKNTEEMYISLTDSKDNLMDFNGNIITCSTEDYEEVNTNPKKKYILQQLMRLGDLT